MVTAQIASFQVSMEKFVHPDQTIKLPRPGGDGDGS
jgi:hypothetical protein